MGLNITPTLNILGERAVELALANGGLGRLSHIALGRGQYHPAGTEGALTDEVARAQIETVTPQGDHVEITATVIAPEDFTIGEVGFLFEDGTPFAIWSEDPVRQYPELDLVTGEQVTVGGVPQTRAGRPLASVAAGTEIPFRYVIDIGVYGPDKITVVAQPLNEAYGIVADRVTGLEITKGVETWASLVAATEVANGAHNANADVIFVRGREGVGGAHYKRVAAEPGHSAKFQDATGQWWELHEFQVMPQMFGAKGDGAFGQDGSGDAASTTFTDADAAFTATDVGKRIIINGAGAAGAVHLTTIADVVSATEVTLTDALVAAVADAEYRYGTDDTAALQSAINYVSFKALFKLHLPASHFLFDTLHTFYDAALSDGYFDGSPHRHGRVEMVGAGRLDIAHLRTYRPVFGTVLESYGDGLVVASASEGHGGAPYPARGFCLQNLSLVVDNETQAFEAAACPEIEIRGCSILQRGIGDGVTIGSAWFGQIIDTKIFGVSDASTGFGVRLSTDISAGLFRIAEHSLIDGFQDCVRWTGGSWNGLVIKDTALQSPSGYGVRVESGNISQLQLLNLHFEGTRTGDLRVVGGAVTHLIVQGCYHLGGTPDASYTTGPLLDIDAIDSVDVSGTEVFRPWQTYCRIGAAKNGQNIGVARGVSFIHDYIGNVTGPIYLFAGVIPRLDDCVWTGFASGIHAATTLRAYDPSAGVADFTDKRSGSVSIARMAFPPFVTNQSGTTYLPATGGRSVHDVTNDAASSYVLPTSGVVPDGQWYRIKNNAASAGLLNVRNGDFSLAEALAAGEWADFIFDADTAKYVAFKGA